MERGHRVQCAPAMSSNLYCSQDATAGPAIRADVSNNRMQSFANRPANKVTLILVAVKSCQDIALLHDLCRIVFGEQCHTRLFQLRRGCAPSGVTLTASARLPSSPRRRGSILTCEANGFPLSYQNELE
jgi:hypothetical protein